MPLYREIIHNNTTKVFIWKVDESLSNLRDVVLTTENKNRFNKMKSELHQKAFLAVRKLFEIAGFSDFDVLYDEYGKPHLKNGSYLSISHSFQFCSLIVSDSKPVGVDIEKLRGKIVRIADKFTSLKEYEHLKDEELIGKLTVVWGAKESLYKIYGKKKLSFKEHIHIDDFNFQDKLTSGRINFNQEINEYEINFFQFEDFVCVYVL